MKNEVIHAGYPGDNTRAMLRRMRKDVLSHEPSCVTILCGTNDAVNPRALVPLEEFTKNLNSMVSAVRETDTDLLLISPLPVFSPEVIERYGFNLPPDTDLNPEIMKYARAMRLLAERLGVPYLNLFHIFAETGMVGADRRSLIRNEANSGTKDGAHPTEDGYRFIAALVYLALRDNRCDCSRLVCFGDSITYGYPYSGMGTLEGGNFPALLGKLLNTGYESEK